ncbi:MAG TPA: tRNA lysidine(34) synthetase TilS [Mycobacteriales bacterium]|nr:tRNA lysidine(34) synthetase TilS [Mycobacteriales bacterium]
MKMEPAVAAIRAAVRESVDDLDPGALVLVAVSGGADSLALAAALAQEAARLELRAGAVTVDHGLQDGSPERAADVATTCAELGLDPVLVETVEVGDEGGPEAAARDARYAALEAAADRVGAAAVLLGHTLDDQAETVLLGLARGSGARSLSGMPVRRDRLRRPLLSIRRVDTNEACQAFDLVPWADPHNSDPAYARARVRQEVLPAMLDALGDGIPEALARTAALLRDDADALDEWAAGVADPCEIAELSQLPAAVRRRALRNAAVAAGVPSGQLTLNHVLEIDKLLTHWHGQGAISLPGGLVAERAYDRLTFR